MWFSLSGSSAKPCAQKWKRRGGAWNLTSPKAERTEALTKLKIGHVAQAVRGPFTFDIVERDRKIIYECNHFDRFYMASTEKIAARCLQELCHGVSCRIKVLVSKLAGAHCESHGLPSDSGAALALAA